MLTAGDEYPIHQTPEPVAFAADQIALPEHEKNYLTLALGLVNLCGLALINARSIRRRQRAVHLHASGA